MRNMLSKPPPAAPGAACAHASFTNIAENPPLESAAASGMRREKRGILASIILHAVHDTRRVRCVPALRDSRSRAAHQLLVVLEVMQSVQPRTEYLVRALQVMQIGAREITAGVA